MKHAAPFHPHSVAVLFLLVATGPPARTARRPAILHGPPPRRMDTLAQRQFIVPDKRAQSVAG
ncbi:MAG TPA: hypothetical protein VHA15_06060 [Burkholderiales bacterium]|nr:hypothetical protein [Burkholderiales bacterium]